MTIFDQYRTETRPTYSGSYSSQTVNGNILSEDAATFKRSRAVVAEASTGLTSQFFEKKWLYDTWLGFVSGNYNKKSVRIVTIGTSDETYLDSCAPGVLDIYKEYNGGEFTLFENGVSGSAEFNIPSVSDPRVVPGAATHLIKMENIPGLTTTSRWHVEFPFQSKRGLRFKPRIFNPGNVLINSLTIVSDSGGGTLTVPSSSNTISFIMYGSNDSHRKHFVASLPVHPTAALPRGDSDIKKWESVGLSSELLQKAWFGTGDGLRIVGNLASAAPSEDNRTGPFVHLGGNLPSYRDISTSGLYDETDLFLNPPAVLYGPIVRGFKYGLINSLPQRFNVVFRSDRFGQLRDILEQRPISAILNQNNSNVSVFYPIEIQFVSGTTSYNRYIDYLTASNPSYNPDDSGIYDIHYRSGKPFSDLR